MASAVDICNLALSLVGDRANVSSIDPPEGSAQAEHCARFYPLARDTILSMHAWSFATKRAILASVTTAYPPPKTWQYTYSVPSDMIKMLGVYRAAGTYDEDKVQIEYEVSGQNNTRVLYADIDNPVIRYVTNVTDTTAFSSLLVNAIAYSLASYLAGPIIKGVDSLKISEAMLQRGLAFAEKAKAEDANQTNRSFIQRDTRHPPSWIENRGSLWPYTDSKPLPDA